MPNDGLIEKTRMFIESIQDNNAIDGKFFSKHTGYLTFKGFEPGLDTIASGMKDVVFDDESLASLQLAGSAVRVVAKSTAGTGSLLTLHFEEGKISTVQSQPLPPKETGVAPLALSQKIIAIVSSSLADKRPIVVAHISDNGPVLSYRGSISVLAPDQFGMWIRHRDGDFVRSIRERPGIALMYRNNEAREQLHFQGQARVARNDEENRRIFYGAPQIEQGYDAEQAGIGVVVDLDAVQGFFRDAEGGMLPVRMARQA